LQQLLLIVLVGLAVTSGGGCTVGPDYHPPAQPMPGRWESPPTTQASVTVQQPVQVAEWWTTFHDPTLDSLIQRAVASNLSLEAATQRIRAARASVGVVSAGLWPGVNANADYTRSGGGGRQPWESQWHAGLDAAWEVDIFGGVRRSVEAANANLQASVEDRRDVLVTLLGEVASDYIILRGQQQQIIIAQENLDAQQRNAVLTRDKQTLGTGTELDVVQAESQVASTTAVIATLEASEQQTIDALSVLLGQPPRALAEELQPREKVPVPPEVLPVGLPSDLLRRRPDIRRAERQLAAQTAAIGVATADLFPKFSLTGTFGFQARRIDLIGNWNNSNWSFGPSATWAIFDAGRIWSNIEVQNATAAEAMTAYRQTVLSALQEVQDVLVSYAQEQHRREALARSVDLNQRAVELATRRYKQGLTDFLAVLDAERNLFASQDALVQSDRAVGTDAVALYKALGGGWEIEDGKSATTRAAVAEH
jgi:NodT family efflux transporter outer membrane factor (OMF) lipoprotein